VFAIVFDRHYDTVHRYLARRVGPDLADDLAAETFTEAFDVRLRFDTTHPNARPWLLGIATNLLRHHHRSEARRLRAYARLDRPTSDDAHGEIESRLDAERAGPAIAAALGRLSTDERNVLDFGPRVWSRPWVVPHRCRTGRDGRRLGLRPDHAIPIGRRRSWLCLLLRRHPLMYQEPANSAQRLSKHVWGATLMSRRATQCLVLGVALMLAACSGSTASSPTETTTSDGSAPETVTVEGIDYLVGFQRSDLGLGTIELADGGMATTFDERLLDGRLLRIPGVDPKTALAMRVQPGLGDSLGEYGPYALLFGAGAGLEDLCGALPGIPIEECGQN
jgi:hypothetical protein